MKVFSRAFTQSSGGPPSWAALDEEALRLGSALAHVARHGNLDDFPVGQSDRLALMTTANRRELVTWNRDDSRYELTSLGRQQLGQHRASPGLPRSPASRGSALVRAASPFSPGALIASAACAVLGVFFIAVTLGSFEHAPKNAGAIPRVAGSFAPHEDHRAAAKIQQHSHPAGQQGYARPFSFVFKPKAKGKNTVMARASNIIGQAQTQELSQNPAGYHHNVIHSITFNVA
jgi:hypothetical protein